MFFFIPHSTAVGRCSKKKIFWLNVDEKLQRTDVAVRCESVDLSDRCSECFAATINLSYVA